MADETLKERDSSRESMRGRACPKCGGKIVPSLRAIYESKTDPTDIFPLWQCERCGYEKLSEKPAAPAKAAGHRAAPAKKGQE